jgi:hypothetical protein
MSAMSAGPRVEGAIARGGEPLALVAEISHRGVNEYAHAVAILNRTAAHASDPGPGPASMTPPTVFGPMPTRIARCRPRWRGLLQGRPVGAHRALAQVMVRAEAAGGAAPHRDRQRRVAHNIQSIVEPSSAEERPPS